MMPSIRCLNLDSCYLLFLICKSGQLSGQAGVSFNWWLRRTSGRSVGQWSSMTLSSLFSIFLDVEVRLKFESFERKWYVFSECIAHFRFQDLQQTWEEHLSSDKNRNFEMQAWHIRRGETHLTLLNDDVVDNLVIFSIIIVHSNVLPYIHSTLF